MLLVIGGDDKKKLKGYSMIYIDQWAYISKLKKTDPMLKLLFAIVSLMICIWADSPLISAILILVTGWITIKKGGIPFVCYCKLLLLPISFLLIGVITIAVNYSAHVEGFLLKIMFAGGYIGVTGSGVQTAFGLFMKAWGAVSCLYFLSLSTPMVSLLYVFRKLKVPKLLVELIGLSYRFIFILMATADTIYISQNARLGYSSIEAGYRSLGGLASMLLMLSYKRSQDLYTALEARGYDGELNVLEEKFKIRPQKYLPALGFEILLLLIALGLKYKIRRLFW
jgi:cobalt/nickel transport system permease protein